MLGIMLGLGLKWGLTWIQVKLHIGRYHDRVEFPACTKTNLDFLNICILTSYCALFPIQYKKVLQIDLAARDGR